ncbi:MAG: VWA domain-containing protein [Candidatus Aenigmarchaeota archaeon]|nr:VWA domain-containing protein [Candidatus Aenigmarchaeota archaeon]
MRRGFIFSTDAMISVGLLFIMASFVTSIAITYSSPGIEYNKMYYRGKDVMNLLQNTKLSGVADMLPENFTQDCNISTADLEKSILDTLGYLWAQNSTVLNSCAGNLTRTVLNRTLPDGTGYEVLIDGVSIYRKGNATNYLSRLHTIVSGYQLGKPVSGYFASAYISRISKTTSSYVYFGGYEGDGNITKKLDLPDDANVTEAYLELASGNNFTLYVNGNNEGSFTVSPFNMTADNWTICSDYASCGSFSKGENIIKLVFSSSEDNYIGGGFMRVTYNTSKPDTLPFQASNESAMKYYYFPGIEGMVNLYSSFYIPGNLDNMTAHIHYASNCTSDCKVFVNIGNTTVYESNSTGDITADIGNATLYSLLGGYSSLSNSTVPLRMGYRNMTHDEGKKGTGDSVLSTDVSGSMQDCADYTGNRSCWYEYCRLWIFGTCLGGWGGVSCDNPGTCSDDECAIGTTHVRNHRVCDSKLNLAQDGNKVFVNTVLNYTGNRVGLVNYSTSTLGTFSLTDDNQSLHDAIDTYEAGGGTCICCGIISATDMLNAESNSSNRRSIIVMSDGEANRRCNNADTDLDGDSDVDAADDTIQAACDAYNDSGIVVYTIGYGDADNTTMNLTAECGGGEYYFSNATGLADTYRKLAEDIAVTYFAQTVKVDYANVNSTLYSDSYITFNYTPKDVLGYGEVSLAFESPRFGGVIESPKNSTFSIPSNSRILDAKTLSYSSQFWTSSLEVNSSATGGWESVYDISDYSSNKGAKDEFIDIGDPFVVHMPIDSLISGNNSVRVDTGFSSNDTTGGSPDDRVVYYVGVSGIVGYGDVFSTYENATDDAVQRLQDKLSEFNITALDVVTPTNYVSELPALWGPSIMEIRVWS